MYNDTISIKAKTFSVNLHIKSIISVNVKEDTRDYKFLLDMLEALKNVNASNILESNININDIIICRKETDIQNLLVLNSDCTGKTIFIDRYDFYKSDELDKFILSGKNRIILMSHTFYNRLNLHSESFIMINYTKDLRLFYTDALINHLDEEII